MQHDLEALPIPVDDSRNELAPAALNRCEDDRVVHVVDREREVLDLVDPTQVLRGPDHTLTSFEVGLDLIDSCREDLLAVELSCDHDVAADNPEHLNTGVNRGLNHDDRVRASVAACAQHALAVAREQEHGVRGRAEHVPIDHKHCLDEVLKSLVGLPVDLDACVPRRDHGAAVHVRDERGVVVPGQEQLDSVHLGDRAHNRGEVALLRGLAGVREDQVRVLAVITDAEADDPGRAQSPHSDLFDRELGDLLLGPYHADERDLAPLALILDSPRVDLGHETNSLFFVQNPLGTPEQVRCSVPE